jgi:hypothetical protein
MSLKGVLPMADTVMIREATPSDNQREGSYIDWPCALAGAAIAGAISFVLFTFGSGIGLSIVSPWAGTGSSMMTVAVLATLFAVLVQVGAFAAGGYLAGRMRRPWNGTKPAEVEYRDGVHGALVWAVGVLFGALLLAMTAGGVTRGAADAGMMAAQTASTSTEPTTYAIDGLFRSNIPYDPNRDPGQQSGAIRAEAGRLLATGVGRGEMSMADRTYLAQLVANRTGLTMPEAVLRVDQAIITAKATVDRARKAGILAAFLAAASLLAGLVAAWSAALTGGAHRDQGIIWRGFARHDVPTDMRVAQRR